MRGGDEGRSACADSGLPRSDDEGNESTRSLGLVVARGTLLTMIAPSDGSQEIENPFMQQIQGM